MTNGEKTLLIDIIKPVVDKILAQKVDDAVENNSLKELCQKTWELCSSLLELIDELQLPPVKPRVVFLTDAGPGVGVSNFEVKFRDAELARMYNSGYRIRLHRSRGDSGQGEAEQTNSAIADSIVDGAAIDWEVIKRYQGMTNDEISQMSVKEFEQYESERMSKMHGLSQMNW